MKITNIYKTTAALIFLMAAALWPAAEAWGQGTDTDTDGWKTSYSGYTIQHKATDHPTKWHDLYKGVTGDKSLDRFEDDVTSFTIGGQAVQPAHAVVDTIYAYPGQTITLYSPDIKGTNGNGDANNRTYQRWYNYNNDGLFADGMLKPLENQSGYRLRNGYVGYPLTHNGGSNLYGVQFTMPNDITSENQEFIVACDVSIYTDYGIGPFQTVTGGEDKNTFSAFLNTSEKKCYEPTIGHRLIYYVRSIERPTGVTDENDPFLYRKRVYEVQEKEREYVAEYTIHFPNVHVSKNTPEVLGLRMDAMNYKLPGNEGSQVELTVAVDKNANGGSIGLRAPGGSGSSDSITLSDRQRFFYLIYPERYIDDGAKTVITVRNGTTNLIKYNIIFDEGTELVTESQLGTYDPENETQNPYAYRTEEYLKAKYGEPFTELNFDYAPDNADYGKQVSGYSYYPFPMPWESSSYGFHDGGPNRTFNNNTTLNKDVFTVYDSNTPVWGYYAFSAAGNQGLSYEGNTYYMNADLSDRPGVIAQLPFREALCPGAELFVTAWVNTPHAAYNSGNADVGIRFSIMGRKNVGGMKGPWTSIYSHNSGQITKRKPDGTQIEDGSEGEWQQLYFSFINGDTEDAYDEYCLQLENVSSSTIGADLFLDKIQVFMATPSAAAEQKRVECEKRTMLNFRINWDQLYSRLGGEQQSEEIGGIDFCLLDTLKYREVIPYGSDPTGKIEEAIQASAVWIGNQTTYNEQYGTLYYIWNFDSNTPYNDSKGDCLAAYNIIGTETDPKYAFYRLEEVGEKYLAVDIQAELVPTRTYWLLIQDHGGTELTSETFASSFGNPDDKCAMRSKLSIVGQNLVKINGEVVTDADLESYCTGQSFTFSVDMRAFDDSGETTEAKGIYFDWFFGDQETFEGYYTISDGNLEPANADTEGAVSLENALAAFRDVYMDAEDLTNVVAVGELTENHIALIQYYLDHFPEGEGLNHQLVLHKQTLDIRLLEKGLDLVVVPINPKTTETEQFCFTPSFLELRANGKAPQVQPGFEYVNYQDANGVTNDAYNPAMRIGLKQIKASETNAITVNLRNAKFAYGNSDTNKPSDYNPEHLGLMNEDNEGHGYIYLVGSDDPAYADLFGEDMDMHQYVIGTVESLSAKPNPETPDDNQMKIKFNLTPMEAGGSAVFDPKEGYSYTMHIHVEEKTGSDASITSSCYGNMNLVMKVVPEYLEWAGTETSDNWHDDALWKRISSDRINKAIDESSSDYFKNGSNTTEKAYVPMLFTKVIMPKNSQVELYKAGFEGDSEQQKGMSWSSERPTHIDPPAIVNIEDGQPIYYDMMVYSANGDNKDMVTKPFRVSLLDEIHFEPGAEMKHAEYLLYNKAWVDYQLTGGRWYALSSPLKGVVSGDFYTDPSGMEAQEYFTDITFDGKINGTISSAGNVNENNSRTNPSVYQRGWKGDDVTMVGVGSGDTGERAIAGNWSAVYNKADEGYDAGTGFSLKVLDLPEGTNNATFRLPKADTKYTYSGGTTTAQETDPITRTNANKLHVTDLNSENTSPITVTLEANGNNPYYLVGNPFMAHLDMSAFFNNDVNGSVLEKKYWLVTDGNQTAAVGTEGSWVTVDGNSTPTVAPLQSFFVQKKTGVSNNDITFTQDMQTLGGTNDGLRSANALTITATTTDGRTSRAAVAYDMAASADYEASEDAELFLDSNLGDVPMVYTVAGTMATSINRTSELYNIPLGVYGSKQEMVTLSFGGLTQFSSATLYDAQEQTETPLHEGKTVSVPAGTSGRYFLRAGTPTGNEVIARNAFLVYSVGGGKVMVTSSNTPLKDIRVYTMGGAQVRSIQASGMQQEIYLNRGIYLITVSDQDGLQETRKVLVR
ncbi:MAG: T9SS type A sorting domain-containing protein [Parabacteroides sp.]|nr:T9SS type A sorting domain-containing protein [Parabacteroides sp.]